ncbi:MAG: FMN-binding protein [Campylobacterota bacterium]|nr:FMN-binding protein [Campylobacterota bacterium]
MNRLIIPLLLLGMTLQAQILISPIDSMKENFGKEAEISKKNILLSKSNAKKVQKDARLKLDTKIYRIFSAKKGEQLLGYGILINRKVRSKNAVILYIIENDKLTSIDIIAFNEPLEYIPSNTWKEQFNNTSTSNYLQLNRDIPTITGATLSARSITDGSRLAFSLYNTLLKGK